MKPILYISFLIILFLGGQNSKSNVTVAKTIVSDTIFTEETKYDTIIKISEPFILNKILCYWEHSLIVADYGIEEITMTLKDSKTNRILLEYSTYVKHQSDFDYKSDNYFDEINSKHFEDVNFDGFKDFIIYSYGSMAMTSATNIHVFNTQTKEFVWTFSVNTIEQIDSVNRILITRDVALKCYTQTKIHFGKKGKIKFIEEFSEEFSFPNDTTELQITTYTKSINGEVVKVKIDTTYLYEY